LSGNGRCDSPEHLNRNPIVVGNAPPTHLGPHVVPASGGHDGELLAWKFFERRELELRGAELVERALGLDRQELIHDPDDRFEAEAAGGEIDLAGWCDDVRLVADVHDQCFAVELHDRLEERRD
jgi:hypothetical protein